jgi:hypothetical protein
VLDTLAPLPDAKGRSRTIAEAKRETLGRLWDHDMRVAPWRGTAFGVMQTMSTWAHHEGTVRRVSRPERNMLRAVSGDSDALDRRSVEAILEIAG